jgi:hypothetical protein
MDLNSSRRYNEEYQHVRIYAAMISMTLSLQADGPTFTCIMIFRLCIWLPISVDPMCTLQHRWHDLHFLVPIQGTRHDSRGVRLDVSQVDSLATVLSGALQNEPNFKYLIPDEQARRTILPWFFRAVAIRACHVYGEIYTTPTIEGGALWISPGHTPAFEEMVRREMLAMPFKLGWTSFRRCVNLAARLEAVRKRLVRGPHWYLMVHGVKSSKQERAIGAALLEPVLSRADSYGLPCYLETFQEKDLPLYEACGFRVQGAGQIPGGGPIFWALMT